MSVSIKVALAGLAIALILAVALVLTAQGPSADGGRGYSSYLGQRRPSGFVVGTLTKNTSCSQTSQCASHILKRSDGKHNSLWSAEFNTTGLLDTLTDYTTAHPSCIVRIDGVALKTRLSTGTFPGPGEDVSVSDAHLFSSTCGTSGSGGSGGSSRQP